MRTQIIGRRLLLGAAVGALAAQRAQADTNFTNFRFPATSAPTARTMPDRLAEIKNVKDFGAVGDKSHDDTSAIQAAVDLASSPYTGTKRGAVFFPPGIYKLTSSITFPPSIRAIGFLGAPGAKLEGNFADALLKRDVESPYGGVYYIENLEFENNHAAGKAIVFHSCVGASVRNCAISAFRGIETYNSQSINVDSCSISSGGLRNAVGIIAGNATMVTSTDISGCLHGIRHCNLGLVVMGGRYEVNTQAVVVGLDWDGNVFQSSGFHISGLSMEANQTAIDVIAGAGGFIGGVAVTGGVTMAYGVRLRSAQNTTVSGVTISTDASYTSAGFSLETATQVRIEAVGSPSWNISRELQSFGLENCDTEITVSQLPTSAKVGTVFPIRDATSTTVGSTVAGGGSNHVAVVRSAGAWRII
jgi:hypothetical protein